MPDKGTKKKVTRVSGGTASPSPESSRYEITAEKKGRAFRLRLFAFLAWLVAIGLEVWAIFLLQKPPVDTTRLIILLAVMFAGAVTGSILWKKANRLSPASEKEPIRFFIQNQLGAIITVIAFLPLIVLIFTNKDLKGKQKGLVGGIAVVALLVAGVIGIDFNPPSIEQYAEESARVEQLMGENLVYWTPSGTKYHTYSDCYHINTDKTEEIFSGTVAQARELKNITELCKTCEKRAERESARPERESTEVDNE